MREYGRAGLSNLKNACGFQIIYYGGWDTWLAFVPKTSDRSTYTSKTLRDLTGVYIERFKAEFQRQLKILLDKGVATDTLSKNNLENLRKVFVLPGDRQIILSAIQRSIEDTKVLPAGLQPMIYTFRFGEKCRTPVLLPVLHESGVEDICVHLGINISNNSNDILWCREGVNNMVGRRGKIVSSLSFFECVNFQSNLDEREIDVSRKLLEICQFPDSVRFVQLYSDTPHYRPQTVVHPVSASVILAEGIFRETSQAKLRQDALEYLSEIRNNFNQIREATCRMEFVVALPTPCCILDASKLVKEENVLGLLKEEPMIVPFEHCEGVMGCIREVGLYISEQLDTLFRTRRGTSDSVAVWEAYQYECAVERLLWGNPFCMTSCIYAINLGVGLGYPTRCLTDQKGFLCLEDSAACCIDERSTPPLTIYTHNMTVQRQITRVFGIYDHIESSSIVTGTRIIMCLIKDLHETGKVFSRFKDFLISLKRYTGNDSKRIVGGVSVKGLAERLARCRKVKWPMVFGTVMRLLGNDAEKIARVCVEGINALELGYFPAVRDSDENRNEGLNWRFTYGLWVLTDDEGKCATFEAEAASLHMLVLGELEKYKVCHMLCMTVTC